jgi:hypothetical protein
MTETDPPPEESQPNLLDLSLKTLCRHVPAALLRLAGVEVDAGTIYPEDVSVILPEFRADDVLLIGPPGDPDRWGVHFEYQAQPDARQLRKWWLKNAALNEQLDLPVFLVILYVERGDRRGFPDSYTEEKGSLVNSHQFTRLLLWEHAERIRSGELAELAPLLVLCEDSPTEATLQEELGVIRSLEVPESVRADLLAVA